MAHDFDFRIVEDTYCIYECPPEWIVDEAGAIYHRVYYPIENSAVFEDQNHSLTLKKGNIYIFPTNKPFKISHDPQHPFKCLWFHIIILPTIFNPVIEYNVSKTPIAKDLMTAILNAVAARTENPCCDIVIEGLLYSLLYVISLEKKFILLNNTSLVKVIKHIHENYMEDLSNECLAAFSGYDKSYFIRLFKKTFNVSPQRYILNYRVSKAIGHIRNNYSIVEVAHMIGYEDEKAFCRAFKKVKGVPPSAYKKSHYLQP